MNYPPPLFLHAISDQINCSISYRGKESIEVDGRTVGTFRIVHYIVGVHFSGVSVKRGSTV